ncbi:MAG: SUMF1/EgtB/PvdO family nonheme iron enzyme [Saprospiraceae bacterium]|nr:SUMF1/EgtB/PvdO family nonheme iron enzyme [Saprospiraceae bacterium]
MKFLIFKITAIVFLIPGIYGNLSAQKKTKLNKRIKGYKMFPINDSVYMKESEVSVNEWVLYFVKMNFNPELMPDLKKVNSDTRKLFQDLLKKDSSKYFKFIRDNRSDDIIGFKMKRRFKKEFKPNDTYSVLKIPIVGITYDQAKAFCVWRQLKLRNEQGINGTIRLPSVEEYTQVIENIDSINGKQCAMLNFKDCGCTKNDDIIQKYQGVSLVNVICYFPSQSGLYQLQGNAAEMTLFKDVSCGGSFMHYAKQSSNKKRIFYAGPEPWLGFRYVLDIK